MQLDNKLNLLNVSRETSGEIEEFVNLLIKWNKKISLMSPNDILRVWERHVLESIEMIEYIASDEEQILCDFGSGCGFPGVITGIIGNYKELHLIESNTKKAQFLKQATNNIKKNLNIHNNRIEKITKLNADIITARAFASLVDTLIYTQIHGNKNTILYTFKGKKVNEEIHEAKAKFIFDYELTKSKINYHSYLLKLSNIGVLNDKKQNI